MAWDVLGIKDYEFSYESTNKKGEKIMKSPKILETDSLWN